ncbi:HEPN domain-containing protein [Burkholderia ubonensis]|uniref:HEPN domain-containing protein n=1 Tax=Burkholderia ubonensis TaxID=101571 RepID=UPI000ABAFE7C|nr:HEPN domain-containing protein [Burkholderia ubonensis]
MNKFHRGQLDALERFVANLRINASNIPLEKEHGPYDSFQNQIINAPPWKGLIGKVEFGSTVWRIVYRNVSKLPKEYNGDLSDFANGKSKSELVNDLQIAFESLPCRYDIYIPMGSLQKLNSAEIKITDDIAVSDASDNENLKALIASGAPDSPLLRALTGRPPISSKIDSIRYLKISCTGFASDMPDSPSVRTAWSIAKQLAFVGMATDALSSRASELFWDDSIWTLNDIPTLVVPHNNHDEIFRTSPGFELGRLLHSLKFKALKFLDFGSTNGKSLLGAEEREAQTGDEIQQAVSQAMRTAAAFLTLDTPDAVPIRAAMEWFIDADASQNETVAFLQRCIGLEALLGSSESRRDVTERLADRYSYLVAQTASARDAHRRQFKSMYDHRSEIVHGRSTRLSDEHRNASWQARHMLLQVAWREMQNLLAQSKSS